MLQQRTAKRIHVARFADASCHEQLGGHVCRRALQVASSAQLCVSDCVIVLSYASYALDATPSHSNCYHTSNTSKEPQYTVWPLQVGPAALRLALPIHLYTHACIPALLRKVLHA
jgi:hypothetical protein